MQRIIESSFTEQLKTNKIVLLSGPPSVGKMPFAEKCLQQLGVKYEVVDFKNKKIRKKFSQLTEEEMRWYFNQFQFVVIGNAQLFESLQQVLNEVLSESIKASVILSCSFEPPIIEELKEALKWEGLDYYLPAPTYYELTQIYGMAREDQRIEHRLIFGNYPQIADFPENAAELLLKIVDETIATQLGVEDRVNKKAALMRTLQIAAHLVGEAISYNQIAEKIDTGLHAFNRICFNNNVVYVHCAMGVSRSASCIIMYIMKKFKVGYQEVRSVIIYSFRLWIL